MNRLLNHLLILLLWFGSKDMVPRHNNVYSYDEVANSVLYIPVFTVLSHGDSYNHTTIDEVDDDDDDYYYDDDHDKAYASGGSFLTDLEDYWDMLLYNDLGKQGPRDVRKSIFGAGELAVINLVLFIAHIYLANRPHALPGILKRQQPDGLDVKSSSSRRKRHKKPRMNCEKGSPSSTSHLSECNMEGTYIGKLFMSDKEIAKGSNGTIVFEGTYNGREVAVKRLLRAHHDIASKEIQNLIASDEHPNIVRWYGVEYDHNFVYLSLERCACSLYDLIQNKMNLGSFQLLNPNGYPSSDLLKLMRGIVDGLVYLHELRIIHRDLKPHNVLIVKRKGLCAKLSDMGISKRLVGDASSLGPNATGSGSSGWRAPEQIPHGPEQICQGRQTPAMDLFSLGCVLFFCMTGGEHPFGDHLERDINVINNKVSLFLVQHIPEALDLFSRLLNFEPELRPKASEVPLHPLFWNFETRMSFMRDTSDWVESESRKVGSVVGNIVLRALKSKGRVVFRKRWDVVLDPAFLSQMKQHRKYSYNMVRDLIRFVRNTMNHYGDLPKNIQSLFGSMPEGIDDYFRSKFPKLLMEVYNVMYQHCKHEEWFRRYLEN